MSKSDVAIIVGGSHAAVQLALSLRLEGWEGQILVITDDSYLPYHRPPLSKDYLSGETQADNLLIRQPAFYEKQAIDFRLNTQVVALDPAEHRLTLDSGESLSYTKLALCTGARARKLDIPGARLKGVHYLRDLSDAEKIKANLKPGGRAVIIGGGYIGLETASLLRKIGMEVCVLEAMDRVLQRVTSAEISAFYTRVHSEEGVEIKTNVAVTEIVGGDFVEKVLCSNGEEIEADLVIVGIGVIPNIELAESAGLDVDNGILVNEFAQTSDADIVSAGDCTNYPNLVYGGHTRLESVPNATEQAKTAAASICGNQKSYDALPWFWSNQYDLKLQIAGLNQGYDQVAIRGDIEVGRSFVVWYLKEGRVIAADCINRPVEFMLAKQLLTANRELPMTELLDDSTDAKSLLALLRN